MEPTDLTIQILREIRDEIRTTREELSGRIDQTNARLDKVERRQSESEVRLSTELIAVAQAVEKVRVLLAERNDIGDKVDDHEKRLRALETTQHA